MKIFGRKFDTFTMVPTIIALAVITIVIWLVALTGIAEQFAYDEIFKLIGKTSMGKAWAGLLAKILKGTPATDGNWFHMTYSLSDVFQEEQVLWSPLGIEVIASGLLVGFVQVLAKAFLDSIITAICCELAKLISFGKHPLLASMVGVTLGLLITTMLGNATDISAGMKAFLYAAFPILLLLIGIVVIIAGHSVFSVTAEAKSELWGFILGILKMLPVPIATTGYFTTATLVMARRLPLTVFLIMTVFYLLVLFLYSWGGNLKTGKFSITW